MKKLLNRGLFKNITRLKAKNDLFNRVFDRYKDYTMIPQQIYCDNLQLAKNFANKIEGDVIECGVWKGGMSAGLSEILGKNREYYLFDSFEGLPKAKAIDGIEAIKWQNNIEGESYYDNCTADIQFAINAMEKSRANYKIFKGWFNETLPRFEETSQVALLRLDGDWYDSTMDCLKYLYPLVQTQGLIIIDDYYAWDGCSKAVHDYLSEIGSASRISTSHYGVCYIIKKDKIALRN